MSILQDTASIVGAIGLTTLVNGAIWSRSLTVAHRYFRLARRESLDVVLVTSGLEEGGINGIPYRRPVTSFGTLQGAAMFAKMLGDLKARKTLSVSVSEQLTEEPYSDLVLLGDPSKNPVAQRFIEDFNAVFPEHSLTRDPVGDRARLLEVGDYNIRYDLVFQATSDNPLTDIGIIIAWLNPFTQKKRRAVFCAGFTGWGTAAAASYYLDDLFKYRYRQLRSESKLPPLLSRKWPCFVCVVEVSLSGDTFLGINELYFQQIPDKLPSSLLRGQARFERAGRSEEYSKLASGRAKDQGLPIHKHISASNESTVIGLNVP